MEFLTQTKIEKTLLNLKEKKNVWKKNYNIIIGRSKLFGGIRTHDEKISCNISLFQRTFNVNKTMKNSTNNNKFPNIIKTKENWGK
jgi:hypothetical protein